MTTKEDMGRPETTWDDQDDLERHRTTWVDLERHGTTGGSSADHMNLPGAILAVRGSLKKVITFLGDPAA